MSPIKIYFENKCVFLCDSLTSNMQELKENPSTLFSEDISQNGLNILLQKIKENSYTQAILLHENLEKLKSAFFGQYKITQAGGGLVKNKKGDILLIFRRGKWDLPKGKLEEGETMEECAVREVQEETGLHQIELGKKLQITFHTYLDRKKAIIKESHWYAMKALGDEKLVPQAEEQITEIKWVPKEELKDYESNTFGAIIEVLKWA
ncbi:MAG: NUDIX hydrolase [Ginsengibacter sp.]